MGINTYTQKAVVPQSQPIPGREPEMAKNNAGGFVFKLSPLKTLERFLILGTEGGTYYAGERKHTDQALGAVRACVDKQPEESLKMLVEISEAGRAVKNTPAIVVLAMLLRHDKLEIRRAAAAQVSKVCRIGTHLFELFTALEGRLSGKVILPAFREWYTGKDKDGLAYQLVKYQQRGGVSHKDVLALAHVNPTKTHFEEILWAQGKKVDTSKASKFIQGFEKAHTAVNVREVVNAIKENDLPWETIPTKWLTEPKVWEALLPRLKYTALQRNLGRLSKLDLLGANSDNQQYVVDVLTDSTLLKKQRIHPLNLLVAWKTYASGAGFRGDAHWPVNAKVVEALEAAYYTAFAFVEPTGKRYLLGVDVSGSMHSPMNNSPVTTMEAAVALSSVTYSTEKVCVPMAFSSGFQPLKLKPKDLDGNIRALDGMSFDSTDCSLPMRYAQSHQIPVDTFIVYTDNETWAGSVHPSQALRNYREAMGVEAKLIVVGMTATEFTIADPKDAGMLDVAGFDTAIPQVIAAF